MVPVNPINLFEGMKIRTAEAVKNVLSVTGKKRSLVVESVDIEDDKDPLNFPEQNLAKDKGQTWGVPIKAQISLIDNATGNKIHTQRLKVGELPKMTGRYSFLVDGDEYQVQHQFRRAPGVYTRVADNGQIEAVVGGGMQKQLKMGFDPTSRRLDIAVSPSSATTIPLIPLLRHSGLNDAALSKIFDRQIIMANSLPGDEKKLIAAASKIVDRPVADVKDAAAILSKHYAQWNLNTRITEDVLGKAKQNLDVEALALSADKLIGISKGTVAPSTYDNVGHKEFLDPGDILFDSLNRSKIKSQGKLKARIDSAEDVTTLMRSSTLGRDINKFFKNAGPEASGLSARAEQANPLAMILGATQTTVMGAGGISSPVGNALSTAQMVHGSQIGMVDPIDTGEKKESGLILPMALGASKLGNTIAVNLYNIKTKKMERVDALTSYKSYVALPDDVRVQNGNLRVISKDGLVNASVPGGRIEKVSPNKLQYVMLTASQQFGIATNMVPFLQNNNGNRMMMAAKMARQAVALKDNEQPLVQIEADDGDTFESHLGKMAAHVANADGVVSKITKEQIVVKDAKGQPHITYLYDRFITTEKKTGLNSTPLVKVGDKVKKGQVIADQTFTKGGVLSLGKNLNVGFMPYKGYTFEDGVVISESAAAKLTSVHTNPIDVELSFPVTTIVREMREIDKLDFGAMVAGKGLFRMWAPNSSQSLNVLNIGDDGIVKEGTVVKAGEPIILAIKKTRPDLALAGMRGSRKTKNPWKAAEVLWDKSVPGKVTKVVKNGRNVRVLVETEEPMTLGDKLVGRYGNKGVVTKILPDKDMPYTTINGEKRPLEVLMNPAGVTGRINPGQIYELAAAKIALKTGSIYKVKNFDSSISDMSEKLENELKTHKLSEQDDVYDPEEGSVGKITAGPMYIQKLLHQVDKKLGARSGGVSLAGDMKYAITPDKQPARGDGTGGQSLSTLGLYALLGHNARMNIQELQTHKSTYEENGPGGYNSDDFWLSLMTGAPLPAPASTFAYKKFISHLKGVGVNVVKNGHEMRLTPFTDKDLLAEDPHEVKDAGKMLIGTTGEPDKGGLFDFPKGIDSTKWGYIKLAEPVPNPVMQHSIEVLLDLPRNSLEDVMAGKRKINGEEGGIAIKKALAAMDPAKELERLKKLATTSKSADKDKVYKKIKLLNNLNKLGLSADEAYVNSYLPILPPAFRPISLSEASGTRGQIEVTDVNLLYKNVGLSNSALSTFDKAGLPEQRGELRARLYESVKRAYIEGLPSTRGTHANGILQTVTKKEGGQSKDALYQSKIIKRRSELSGRGVIVPEPALTLDEVGLPRKMALEIYKPFVIKELGSSGYSALPAAKLIAEDPKNPAVNMALQRAMSTRPVFIKRDPVLHKYSVMAFRPQLHEGKAIQIHPLVCKGFNADFDGDTMAVFLPASDKAVEEAKKMMPSQNLFSSTTFKLMNVPKNEMIYGLYQMTLPGPKTNKTFPGIPEILTEFKNKQITIKDQVMFNGNYTCAGKCLLYMALTQAVKMSPIGKDVLYGPVMDDKRLNKVMSQIATQFRGDYPMILDAWKNLGNKYVTALGSSFSIKDLRPLAEMRDKHLAAADKIVAKLDPKDERARAAVYMKATENIVAEAEVAAKAAGNKLYEWTKGSGALGKWNQISQMIVSPLMVVGGDGKIVPNPIRKSYAEGLSTADYWNAVNGVRTGTIGRAKETQEPGAQAKRIMNLAVNLPITVDDCGTLNGVNISTSDIDAEGRYLAADVGKYKRGEVTTTDMLLDLRPKFPVIKVRSPLKCAATQGLCSICCGINEEGKRHEKGINMGVLAGQALSEPLTQMTMNSFHTGGSALGAGAKSAGEFATTQQLLKMPQPDSMRIKAVIAEKPGKVLKIYEDTVAGGKFVVVEGKTYRVDRELDVLVKVGDMLTAGQPISDGPISPHELLEATDMDTVRNYLVKSLHEIYDKKGVRRRNIETVVRNLTNTVQVVEDPTFEYTPKDVISETKAIEENQERIKEKLPPLKYKPIIKGIDEAAKVVAGSDWLARLNHIGLENVIETGVAHGYVSKLHGANPLPGIAFGAEFGRGDEDWEY
jgi:DNA-directed RNA polymerase subunit beta'